MNLVLQSRTHLYRNKKDNVDTGTILFNFISMVVQTAARVAGTQTFELMLLGETVDAVAPRAKDPLQVSAGD
jgi:hypothetical protein